jgi:hypothetical protein
MTSLHTQAGGGWNGESCLLVGWPWRKEMRWDIGGGSGASVCHMSSRVVQQCIDVSPSVHHRAGEASQNCGLRTFAHTEMRAMPMVLSCTMATWLCRWCSRTVSHPPKICLKPKNTYLHVYIYIHIHIHIHTYTCGKRGERLTALHEYRSQHTRSQQFTTPLCESPPPMPS